MLGEQKLTREFELLPDPRVEKAGITTEIIQNQISFQMQVLDLMSAANLFEADLKARIKELKNKKDLSGDEKQKLQQSKEALAQMETAEGIYMRPMLTSQISYLYYMVSGADQKIGKDAIERLDELQKWFNEVKSRL